MASGFKRRAALTGCVLLALSALAGVLPAAGAVGPADWPAFLAGPAHTSDNKAQTAITPGTPSLDGAGVLAVGTYGATATPNAVYLLNARTGKILRTLITGSTNFAQSVFAGGWLFTANGTGVYAWGP